MKVEIQRSAHVLTAPELNRIYMKAFMMICENNQYMKYLLILPGDPKTKKNSQRILKNSRTGASFIAPSNNYVYYQNQSIVYIRRCSGLPPEPISYPVNVRVVYYMETRRRVDLVNLLEATMDILVHAQILADDNSNIVAGHDGSRVLYDRAMPRAEVFIDPIQ